jgi:hypothetical protein
MNGFSRTMRVNLFQSADSDKLYNLFDPRVDPDSIPR